MTDRTKWTDQRLKQTQSYLKNVIAEGMPQVYGDKRRETQLLAEIIRERERREDLEEATS